MSEFLKYGNFHIDIDIKQKLQSFIDKISDVETELEEANKEIERLEEQLYFRNEFITSVKIRCENATRCKELVKDILTELEDSYIEL
jgi:hypothetical protein